MGTQHFSETEWACHHCGQTPSLETLCRLMASLEVLRHIAGGRAFRIVSGLRCPEHNSAVGGAPNSRHLVGDAADLEPGLVTPGDAEGVGITGIGIDAGGWVIHVDTRPGDVTHWWY